jgi:alkanesulfonate monooxygenase SsuD/methylene tetrahydromethanopterin reductase-like flavin-dependent oxidoreductase (luciferase family)
VGTKLQFGLNVPTSAAPGADPVALAKRAEDLGFDFVSANDHPGGAAPTFEVWTMLSWIAASTSRIKVATRVLGVPYRPPAMVAKMAESLDRLSGGRLILGLGGGASDEEFRSFGLRVPTPREKVEGLEEAIRIAHGLWSEQIFTFDGRHYRTEGATLEPKPDHRIPIWLGTYGPRALAVTGRLADGWIPTYELAPPERIPEMRDTILKAAEDVGRDPEKVTLVYNLDIQIGEGANAPPYVLSGQQEDVTERLMSFVRLGFTAMNFAPAGPDADEQIERLGKEVIPTLRSSS